MFVVFSKREKLKGKVAILESSLKLAGLLNWCVNRDPGSVGRHQGGVGRHLVVYSNASFRESDGSPFSKTSIKFDLGSFLTSTGCFGR